MGPSRRDRALAVGVAARRERRVVPLADRDAVPEPPGDLRDRDARLHVPRRIRVAEREEVQLPADVARDRARERETSGGRHALAVGVVALAKAGVVALADLE